MLRSASRAALVVSVVLVSTAALAQDEPAPETPPAAEQPAADAPAAESAPAEQPQGEFGKLLAQFREVLAKIKEMQLNYKLAKPEDRPAIEAEFAQVVEQGNALHSQLVELGLERYTAGETDNKELSDFLIVVARDNFRDDNYDLAFRVSKLLSDNDYKDKQTQLWAGLSAWALGDYDNAEKYLKMAEASDMLDEQGRQVLAQLPQHREVWEKEQAIREQEAAADDLPRVLLKTTRGDILIELFENEAPNTVANFIDLVEKKFYDGLIFHRVIHGFMAQGGDPEGTGRGGPGYTIPGECHLENHRNHFRGSLSMAHTGQPDSGGSQFFITYRPTTHLDGRHTVFGRVIEGFDVMPQVLDRDPDRPGPREPDKIISATVVRKRDHEYKPTKTAE